MVALGFIQKGRSTMRGGKGPLRVDYTPLHSMAWARRTGTEKRLLRALRITIAKNRVLIALMPTRTPSRVS